jgi:hypothetical protein
MTHNNQAQPFNIISLSDFKKIRRDALARAGLKRAKQVMFSGRCSADVVSFYSNAADDRERLLAISCLMTDSEMDALADLLDDLIRQSSTLG